MLMKKFLGATAREAMQKMKAELGPEALVISNRKTADGVEILAMVEASADSMAAPPAQAPTAREPARPAAPRTAAQPQRPAPAPPATVRQQPPAQRQRAEAGFTSLKDYATRIESTPARAPATDWRAAEAYAAHQETEAPAQWGGARGQQAAPAPQAPQRPAPEPLSPPSAWGPRTTPNEQRLLDELTSMKSMLQSQIAGLAWRDMAERRPLAVQLWRELVDAGFSPALARAFADKLPDDLGESATRKWLADVLARNIRCVDPARDMVETGGVFALVGPTGVGKTTTTAKLAARCVVKYGAQSLGLITTDSYRIGAFDQLSIYGKILGVPVHSAQSYGELEATIATMAGKRMVLIDTTGMGQRDNRVAEQINLLNNPHIKRVLLLNAAAQAETLEDVARAYQGRSVGARPLAGAILTKVDEAAKLAPALDILARHGLELQHVTNGQRVPEDLHAPAAPALVHRALKAPIDPVFAMRDNEVAARAMPPIRGTSGGHAGARFDA